MKNSRHPDEPNVGRIMVGQNVERLRGIDPSFAWSPRNASLKSSVNCKPDHCSKFAVVIGSKRLKSRTNGSTRDCCIGLRNIVKSEIFRINQKSRQCYESAALTS
jgi:hypothetical protein